MIPLDTEYSTQMSNPSSSDAQPSLSFSKNNNIKASEPTSPLIAKQHAKCELYKHNSLTQGLVRYIFNTLYDKNINLQPYSLIQCIQCNVNMSGAMYYKPDNTIGIAMCENKLSTQSDFNVVLTHELIHTYDYITVENDIYNNPYTHACTEIRAANLSGDCTYPRELRRGHIFSINNHHNQCVRRRALLSVASNPNSGPEYAEQYINSVWDKCIKDTQPFNSVPWQ